MARASRAAMAVIAAITALVVGSGCERAGPDASSGVDGDSVPAAPESTLTADLRAALEERLRGPSAGPEAGDVGDAPSMFTAETADALRSVNVDSTGHATVDFQDLRSVIPNASSSAGSTLLLDELNATVFRFPDIRSVEYRMEGSCDLFWEWLQYGCHTVTRPSRTDSAPPSSTDSAPYPEPNPS